VQELHVAGKKGHLLMNGGVVDQLVDQIHHRVLVVSQAGRDEVGSIPCAHTTDVRLQDPALRAGENLFGRS
jgi:hypothetical protein